MSFSGYLPIYRSLIQHTIDRRLTSNEALVLVWLNLLANAETGSYTINVPTLMHYLPELSEDAADRTLRNLQKKGFIYRKITFKSKVAYPYWIEGFIPTKGPMKMRRLDLSQVFRTKDISKLRYMNRAAETAAEGAAETAAEGADETADSNKKGKEKLENQKSKLPSIPIERMALDGASPPKIADSGAHSQLLPAMANSGHSLPIASLYPLAGIGLKWGTGEYLDRDGGRVPNAENIIRVKLGLERRGAEFFDHNTGEIIPWELAQQRISGTNEGRVN